jgi:hypothetical protein
MDFTTLGRTGLGLRVALDQKTGIGRKPMEKQGVSYASDC